MHIYLPAIFAGCVQKSCVAHCVRLSKDLNSDNKGAVVNVVGVTKKSKFDFHTFLKSSDINRLTFNDCKKYFS